MELYTHTLPPVWPQVYVHKFNLVDAFVRNNIGMILNLQEVWGVPGAGGNPRNV